MHPDQFEQFRNEINSIKISGLEFFSFYLQKLAVAIEH